MSELPTINVTQRTIDSKPGWKTTEFSMAWLMTLISGYGMVDEAPMVRAAAFVAIGLVGLGYQLSRGRAKGGTP